MIKIPSKCVYFYHQGDLYISFEDNKSEFEDWCEVNKIGHPHSENLDIHKGSFMVFVSEGLAKTYFELK